MDKIDNEQVHDNVAHIALFCYDFGYWYAEYPYHEQALSGRAYIVVGCKQDLQSDTDIPSWYDGNFACHVEVDMHNVMPLQIEMNKLVHFMHRNLAQ